MRQCNSVDLLIKVKPTSFLDRINFIPDERVPDNQMWLCDGEEIEKIIDLDTNEIIEFNKTDVDFGKN